MAESDVPFFGPGPVSLGSGRKGSRVNCRRRSRSLSMDSCIDMFSFVRAANDNGVSLQVEVSVFEAIDGP